MSCILSCVSFKYLGLSIHDQGKSLKKKKNKKKALRILEIINSILANYNDLTMNRMCLYHSKVCFVTTLLSIYTCPCARTQIGPKSIWLCDIPVRKTV